MQIFQVIKVIIWLILIDFGEFLVMDIQEEIRDRFQECDYNSRVNTGKSITFHTMSSLDDIDFIKSVDRSGIGQHLLSFPEQIIDIADKCQYEATEKDEICICGLGGSAIAGEILAEYLHDICKCRFSVERSPFLPKWAGRRTLVIAVSYSGNTIETLAAFENALKRKCDVVCITSGGKLKELALASRTQLIEVPGGLMPRVAIGYLLGATAYVIEKVASVSLISEIKTKAKNLDAFIAELSPQNPESSNPAKILARRILGYVPVIYSQRGLRALGTRWQNQINENAKMLAFSGEIPEMGHNQIVGWLESSSVLNFLPIFLRWSFQDPVISKVQDTIIAMFAEKELKPLIVDITGNDAMDCILKGVALGDFISYYLAILKGIDPSPVNSIEELKRKSLMKLHEAYR